MNHGWRESWDMRGGVDWPSTPDQHPFSDMIQNNHDGNHRWTHLSAWAGEICNTFWPRDGTGWII